MRVEFVGVGEAFDETLPNNSQVLQWSGCRLLMDCGYSVPHALWKLHPDANFLDGIFLSHRHADHYFGLPSYLLRLAEEHRTRAVDVLCAEGMKTVILEMIDYAYQGIVSKFPFALNFHEQTELQTFEYRGAYLDFAPSSHPVKNFAIRVSFEGKQFCYSGDGDFNAHTRSLYHGCTLLVHEAYAWDGEVRGHVLIPRLLEMARDEKVQRLALTHLQRDVRRSKRKEIGQLAKEYGVAAFIPEPGDICEI